MHDIIHFSINSHSHNSFHSLMEYSSKISHDDEGSMYSIGFKVDAVTLGKAFVYLQGMRPQLRKEKCVLKYMQNLGKEYGYQVEFSFLRELVSAIDIFDNNSPHIKKKKRKKKRS